MEARKVRYLTLTLFCATYERAVERCSNAGGGGARRGGR